MLAVDGTRRWTGALDTARATGLHIQYTIMCSYVDSFRKYFNAFQYLLEHQPCSFRESERDLCCINLNIRVG